MKHISAVNKVSTFFQSKISKKSGSVPTKNNHINSTIVVDSAISLNQGTLDTFVTNFDSAQAELICSLKSVANGFSNRANDELTEAFVAMFPDSRIAKSLSLARTKSMHTVTHGLAPHFKSVPVSTLGKSDFHVYAFLMKVLMVLLKLVKWTFMGVFGNQLVIELRPDTLVPVFLDIQLAKIFVVNLFN